ncbi:MAG: tetratricopeptide repeat protein [Candidatus Lokiarchaeota archaeon]|nr:tetratricopeptide repeat protein [Candidatus Lokiarchaeota archaeon]
MPNIEDNIKKAITLMQDEKFEDSLILLEKLYRENPNDAIKNALIKVLFAYGAYLNDIYVVDYQKAVECFKRIIELDPSNYRAHYNLGIAFTNLGDYDLALDSCNKALSIKPDYKHCYYNIGLIFELKEDLEGALEYYEKTLDLDPKFTYGIQAVHHIRELLDSQRRKNLQ